MAAPAVAEAQDVCASDPNFAVIFAFCERFGDSCGVAIPTFQELQEMLENTDQVPDALVDLHIKLLRRVKKSVHVDKWERAILKFCQGYSISEIWELERYGYKGISIQLKLKILKTLFEAQFDSNPKFKAEINKLESSTLRSQPLGWDKLGTAYWLQFDRACNLRVYREDSDEDTWKIVAKDRSTLVNLINELSGAKDDTLDDVEDSNSIETGSDAEVELSPGLDQEVNSPISPNSTPVVESIITECKIIDSTNGESEKDAKINSVENPVKFNGDDNFHAEINIPIVGETIEENVMIVKGEGSGKECDTGNPDETNTQNETSKNEDVKKPKLWSIETICSSSKEVREEIISVPKSGFFFGDDSVPCFNNVSNGENYVKEEKLVVDPLKENDEEFQNKKKTDEAESTSLSHCDESLNKECSSKNEDDLSSNNVSKQSVFNIKVHEEEVQITERKANEVFKKSNSNIKEDVEKTNIYTPVSSIDTHSPFPKFHLHQVSDTNDDTQSHTSGVTNKCVDTDHIVPENINENKIIDEQKIINDDEKIESKNIENDHQSTTLSSSHIDLDKETVEQENLSLKSDKNSKKETENKSKNDPSNSKTTDSKTDEHVYDCKIEIDNQSMNKINQGDKVNISNEMILTKESPINIVNEQKSIDMVEPKSCELDKKMFSNDKTDNQILLDKSSIINSKEKALEHFISEDNEKNPKVSENINKPMKTTDDSVTNVTSLNYDLNLHSQNEYSTVNAIDLDSKACDQTNTDTVDPCIKTSKLKDDEQINKKPTNTLHNISNIINTEATVSNDSAEATVTSDSVEATVTSDNAEATVTSDSVDTTVSNDSIKANEQLTNINTYENKQLENYQIINEKNLEKNILEEKNIVMNTDSPVVNNNKHSLDNILKKSDKIKDTIDPPHLEKKITEQIEVTDKPIHSNLKFDLQKMDDPEINNEKLETKCIDIPKDLTAVKEEHDLIENNKSIDFVFQSTQENKIIDTIEKNPNFQEKQMVEMIDQSQSVKEKQVVEIIDNNSSIRDKEIDVSINKISSSQENEIVETIDEMSSIQKEKIVKTIDKIPSVHEKKIDYIIDNISSLPEKEIHNPVDNTSKIVKNDDKPTIISIEQCSKNTIKEENLKDNYMDNTKKINLNEKSDIKNTENEKNDTSYKEKLNLEKEEKVKYASDNDENLVHDSSETMDVSKEIDDDNSDEASQNDTLLKDSQTMKNKMKKEINISEDIKIPNLELEENKMGDLEQEVTSPVHEDAYESNNEANEDTFNETSRKELDDNEMLDQTMEDNKKSDEEVEEEPKKRGRPGRKKGKRGKAKKINTMKQEKSNSEEKVKRSYKPRQKKVTIAEEVTVFPEPPGEENIRRSRRIAEIKIKEQFVPTTHFDDIDIPLKVSKKKDKGGKKGSTPSKKVEVSDEEDEEDPISKKFKKRKRKGKPDSLKKLNVRNPWNVDSDSSSSENNIGLFEDYDHEEEDEIPRPGIEPNVSDHEFSPESDINDDDEEYLPEKRARTAHKKDEDEQLKDDMPCQKCNKSDQPEWILLCDTCNQGWHASCLRPALMVIPDGDWYCPHCRHEALLNALKETLKKYDSESKKRENEELRRKRLAYVGISLQNVISSKAEEVKPEKPKIEEESSEEVEEESESESYDSEPLYQLRARRQANVSYRFNDYDDMINEAILEETGIDESAVRKSIDLKKNRNDYEDKTDSDNDENDRNREDSPIAPALLHLRGRKKSKKLTNLDISSDDGSDEDFKGPSDGDDDYEEDLSEYSDDSIRKQPQPTRRSVRNRKTVVDPDFINDDSSEESDNRSKKKRARPWSESSNSEEEDFTWGKKKKKRTATPSSSSLSFKQHKGSKRKHSENYKFQKPIKKKIKYGMDLDSDSDGQPKRRTRGRQITYAESDDSEEEVQTKKRKVVSDEEDEYVLNEEELEAENEDQNLEVDEDVIASNDEKDEELDEEDVVDEEDEDEEVEEDVPKLAATEILPSPQMAAKSPLPNVQSVIRGPPPTIPISSTPSSVATDFVQDPQQNVHQRLLPPVIGATPAQTNNKQLVPPLSVIDSTVVGTLDKRKRPSQQLKSSPSPNSSVDYGGGSSYPFPPDATKVVLSSHPLPPPVHVPYNRPPATTGGGFKPMAAAQPPPGGFPVTSAPYRTVNKISTPVVTAPPAYLPQQQPSQVQQVYQTSPLPANYSPYPIDYANAGTPLPPPPPTIAFRNVVMAPTSHEPLPPTPLTQQSATVGGDSEFGGLVSYFSSQQEDDFDT